MCFPINNGAYWNPIQIVCTSIGGGNEVTFSVVCVNGSLQLFKSMRCSIDQILYTQCTHYNKTRKKYLHQRAVSAISQCKRLSVGMRILFNLNINNLLQREVNWRNVDIWKQCQQQHQAPKDDNILFPSNEHRRKIITPNTHIDRNIYIFLVSRHFHFTTDSSGNEWQSNSNITVSLAFALYYI